MAQTALTEQQRRVVDLVATAGTRGIHVRDLELDLDDEGAAFTAGELVSGGVLEAVGGDEEGPVVRVPPRADVRECARRLLDALAPLLPGKCPREGVDTFAHRQGTCAWCNSVRAAAALREALGEGGGGRKQAGDE